MNSNESVKSKIKKKYLVIFIMYYLYTKSLVSFQLSNTLVPQVHMTKLIVEVVPLVNVTIIVLL